LFILVKISRVGRSRTGPCQVRGIKQRIDIRTAATGGEQECAIGQHGALSIADAATHAVGTCPTGSGWWRYRCPGISDRIVDRAKTRPDWIALL